MLTKYCMPCHAGNASSSSFDRRRPTLLVADAVAAYILDALDGDTSAWHDLQEVAAASSGAFTIDGKELPRG